MTDCHPTLPESLIMQAEALPAKHSKDGLLALEFVSLEGGGGERRKSSSNRFFSPPLPKHRSLFSSIKQTAGKCKKLLWAAFLSSSL